MTIRVGIISAAWGAQAHLPAWRAVPDVEVVGICTAHRETAEAAASQYDVPLPFWDAQDMAAHPDIDLVDAGTRPNLRRDMCLGALEHGKHVYNGLPFAADIEASRQLRDAAATAGTVTAVDAYSEHHGPFRFAEEVLAEATLGTVQSVVGRLEMSLFAQPTSTFPYNWFHDASYGASAFRNLGSHLLHLIVRLLGPVAETSGAVSRFVPRWTSSTRRAGSTWRSPTRRSRRCASSRAPSAPSPRHGQVPWRRACISRSPVERGRLVLHTPMMPAAETTVLLGQAGGALEEVTVPERLMTTEGIDLPSAWPGDPRYAMARSFLLMTEAINGTGEARPDFARGHHVQSVIEATYRSSEGGGWVRPADL